MFQDCFIMLLIMTYNLGIVCAIVAGQTAGYWLFVLDLEIQGKGENPVGNERAKEHVASI
jgi:hypothetical protein